MVVKRLKLKPSVRDKRRYFICSSGDNKEIEAAILEYLGILGFSKSAYMYVKKKNGKVIGSCLVKSLEDVRASLIFAKIKIEKVSGTLKGLST